MSEPTPPGFTAPATTNPLAILSLVFGIAGWTVLPFLGSLVAIILGHLGRGEIRRSAPLQQGMGLALAGLILGYLQLGLAVLGLVIVILLFGGAVWTMHH